jgi:hypothetical protein
MTVIALTVAPEVTPILDRVETELEKNRVPAEIWNNRDLEQRGDLPRRNGPDLRHLLGLPLYAFLASRHNQVMTGQTVLADSGALNRALISTGELTATMPGA